MKDPRVRIIPPEEFINITALLTKDQVKLPIVNINRLNYSLLQDRDNHSLKFSGDPVAKIDAPRNFSDLANLHALPIKINYQMDVWTWSREENDALVRELIWFFTLNPTLKVVIPYGLNAEHNFNIKFDSDIEDNSDIIEHKSHGEYYRQTLSFYTDDAYLWKTSQYINASLDVYYGIAPSV